MRIGLLSDSHHDHDAIETAMQLMGQVDHIIHAGDNYSDAKRISKEYGVEVTAVKGNTDMGLGKLEKILELNGRKILVTHGHKYQVKRGYQKLYYRALEAEVDIVIFGHSHVAVKFIESNILFINPGSVSIPYDDKEKSFAILEIKDEENKVSLQYFG